MNPYVKKYILRGLIFSGLGPVVAGIIYYILELTGVELNLSGHEVLLAVISTYCMAFVHAGISIFPTIESWSKVRIMAVQLSQIYTVYTLGYLVNGWLPFNGIVFAIYTASFVVGFFVIWGIALITAKIATNKLNKKLEVLNNGLASKNNERDA